MSDKLVFPDKNCPIHGTPMLRAGMNYTCPACVAPPADHMRPAAPPAEKQSPPSPRTMTDFRRWINDVSEALGLRPPSPLV